MITSSILNASTYSGLMRSNMGDDNNGRPMVPGPASASASAMQEKQKSFMSFGFSADPPVTPGIVSGLGNTRRESQGPNVNVTPTAHDMTSDTPEIRFATTLNVRKFSLQGLAVCISIFKSSIRYKIEN